MKLFLLLFFILTATAQAEFLIEPLGGINIGSSEILEVGDPNYNHEAINLGLEAGARTGLSFLGAMGGFEATYGVSNLWFTRKNTAQALTDDRHYNITLRRLLLSGFVGYKFPIALKVWANYYFHANGKVSYGQSKRANIFIKKDSLDGNGFGLGVAFTGVPIFDIFFQYRQLKYDKWNHQGDKKNLPNDDFSVFRQREAFVGISIPL